MAEVPRAEQCDTPGVARPRLLVVKMSSLGDLFHALPAVHVLKEQWNAAVDWVTQPAYVDLVRCFDDVDRVLAFPRQSFLRDGSRFFRNLRADRYDWVVDFQGLLKSALVTRAARGGEKIGPSHAREGSRWFYDRVAGRRNKDRHAVDEAFDVLRLFDLPVPETPVFPVTFPSTDKLGAERPRVAFAACSRWPSKNWPPSHFGETGRALQERTGAAIYLVGSSEDRSVCNGIAAQLEGPVMNLCGDTSLVELGSVLAGMDLVISVDSGPMHMAAAAGASVLALFGPTYPLRTGPYGEKHRVLSADMDCRPCRTRVCRQSPSCMEAIRPAEVVDAAVDMLERSEEF